MAMKDVTVRQLRFLTEVARSGSLAGAAERLHLTAPAIAQQVRLLERSIGLPLIERGPGGQHPTEAGRVLIEAANRIEAELSTCAEELQALRSASAGHVTLGAVSTAKYFAPFVLAAFQKAHPGIRIALRIGNRDEVLSWLENFDVELAVMGRPPVDSDMQTEAFGKHPYVIIAAPDHPIVARQADTAAPLPLTEVLAENVLAREHGSGTRLHLDSLFAKAGQEPNISMELSSNETIKQAVMAGMGVALISGHTVAGELNDGRLAVVDVEGLPICRNWLVVRMTRRVFSPASRELWRFVVAEANGQLPSLGGLAPGVQPTDA
jgi:LysR family transcriptional regulator, low CO2-responsive transcriptional regulator